MLNGLVFLFGQFNGTPSLPSHSTTLYLNLYLFINIHHQVAVKVIKEALTPEKLAGFSVVVLVDAPLNDCIAYFPFHLHPNLFLPSHYAFRFAVNVTGYLGCFLVNNCD